MQYIVLIEKSIYRSSRVQGNAVRFLVDFNGVTRCGLVEARQCQDGSEGGPVAELRPQQFVERRRYYCMVLNSVH